MLAGGRQRGQILADEGAELVERHVAYDDGTEVGCIGEALLIDVEYAVVVGLEQPFLRHGFQARMMAVEDGSDGVVVIDTRRGVAVVEERVRAIHQSGKGGSVATRLCEVEVAELHHGLGILDGCSARDALRTAAHRWLHAHALACEHLAQRGGIPGTHAGLADAAGDECELRYVLIAID